MAILVCDVPAEPFPSALTKEAAGDVALVVAAEWTDGWNFDY